MSKRRAKRAMGDWLYENQSKLVASFFIGLGMIGFSWLAISRSNSIVTALGFGDNQATFSSNKALGSKITGSGRPEFNVHGIKPNDYIAGDIKIYATPQNIVNPTFEFYLNDNFINETNEFPYCLAGASQDGCNNWDTSQYENGIHQLKIVMLGDTKIAQEFKIHITNKGDSISGKDKVDPSIMIAAPLAGVELADGSLQVVATARDNAAVGKMEAFVDGEFIGSRPSSVLTVDWPSNKLKNGQHTLVVKAYDAAGNSATKTVNFVKR